MPQFIVKSQNITVPKYFIETLMPRANPTFVNIYLYALMLAGDNMSIDNSVIAKKLGIIESDVHSAFAYWEKEGIIRTDEGLVEFLPVTPPAAAQSAAPLAVKTKAAANAPRQYSSAEVAKAISSNSELAELALVAQSLLGKPLSTKDTETLYSFYDWLGLPPDVILMLLDHCVSMGKTDMRYIEKVAVTWHQNGLLTVDAAAAYLDDMKRKNSFLYGVRKILGITNRSLSKREESIITEWDTVYHMPPEMISLAYDTCVKQTKDISLEYMNKILENWYMNKITTPEDARRESENHRAKFQKPARSQRGSGKSPESGGYDYNEIERRMWENIENSGDN